MKFRFEHGKRYRARVRLPVAISPAVVVAVLKGTVQNVVIGETLRGFTTLEFTWAALLPREVDSDFLATVEAL